jgi:myb proto-oncogene protein
MKPEASHGVHSDLFTDRSDDDLAAQKQNANAPHRDGFPKAALLLVDALKKNRACQKFIRRKMVNIEAKIEENKDLRDRVKCLLGYQLSCRKSVGRSLGQKEDPRVRLISPLKSTQPCSKVLASALIYSYALDVAGYTLFTYIGYIKHSDLLLLSLLLVILPNLP